MRFPNTGLLLLRESPKAPNKAKIIIETMEGSTSYHIPIIKVSDFSLDAIYEKKLYFLIPFYFFNFEKKLSDIENDSNKTQALADMYKGIVSHLGKAHQEGALSALSYSVIINFTKRIMNKLTVNHSVIREKVGDAMGGEVLDLPEIVIFRQGKAEGEQERKILEEKNTALKNEKAVLENKNTALENKNTALENEKAALLKELEALKEQLKQK